MSKTDDMRRAREAASTRAASDIDELDREFRAHKPYTAEVDEKLEEELIRGRTRFLTIRLSAEEVESICLGWMRQTGTPTGPAKPLRVWAREILLQAIAEK